MKKLLLLFLFYSMLAFCCGQHEYDSVRYHSMLKFVIENQSLIETSFLEEGQKYEVEKLHIDENKTWKLLCKPQDFNSQLHKYYKDLDSNELDLAIRKDFLNYAFEEVLADKGILKEMNIYLDSVLQKREIVDTTKSYWELNFSDSFYDYSSIILFLSTANDRKGWFGIRIEIVFLFDEQNKIKTTNICKLYGL